jgi:predicted transcriptional regulator
MKSKKTFSTRIDNDRLIALKHLAVDTDKALGVLLEEAIDDLTRKYAMGRIEGIIPQEPIRDELFS